MKKLTFLLVIFQTIFFSNAMHYVARPEPEVYVSCVLDGKRFFANREKFEEVVCASGKVVLAVTDLELFFCVEGRFEPFIRPGGPIVKKPVKNYGELSDAVRLLVRREAEEKYPSFKKMRLRQLHGRRKKTLRRLVWNSLTLTLT